MDAVGGFSRSVNILFGVLVIGLVAGSPGEVQRVWAQTADDYRFVRIQYDVVPYNRSRTWSYDYPSAEQNLHQAIERTTNIPLAGSPIIRRLDSEDIFEYPIVYLTEPGYWMTNEEEVERLKKYFARGGFMIIDDFHDYGPGKGPQWNNFYDNIKRVFPDREPVQLEPSHPIWSIYYDIDPVEAVSTKGFFSKYDDEYYAIYDDNGRMVSVICYNQDIGDGWEWPNRNMADASSTSFQMAINFIIYAMTH
jgi:hypothetical protein